MKKGLLFTVSAFIASMGLMAQNQQFTTVGTQPFTVPAGVISLRAEAVGGGGGGGRVTPSNFADKDAAGGGGGGAYASAIVPVTAGNSYNVVVGAGGTNTGSSVDGGNSSFGDGTLLLAAGGSTRSGNDNTGGAEGGKAANSIGSIKYNGGNGGNGNESDVDGGGGGGAAGSGGAGSNGSGLSGGGLVANFGGYGGAGGADGATGASGGTYGGGGGGSSANGSNDRNGGPGASGIVVVSWSQVTGFSPAAVCASQSASVVITGTNFVGVDSVFVNGQSVPFVLDSDTQVTITVPAGTTGGNIIVSSVNGRSQSATALAVTSQTVTVSANGLALTSQYSGGSGAQYQWIDCINGSTPVSGATSASYTAPANGLFALTVTENGCSITSACVAAVNNGGGGNVGIEDNMDANIELSIYPNPASQTCTFAIKNETIKQIRILSASGQLVWIGLPNSTSNTVDISSLAEGIYFAEVSLENTKAVKRLLIVK